MSSTDARSKLPFEKMCKNYRIESDFLITICNLGVVHSMIKATFSSRTQNFTILAPIFRLLEVMRLN